MTSLLMTKIWRVVTHQCSVTFIKSLGVEKSRDILKYAIESPESSYYMTTKATESPRTVCGIELSDVRQGTWTELSVGKREWCEVQ